MTTINTTPLLAFEAYTFIIRKLNNQERYAKTTSESIKARIDAIYDESTSLFEYLFDGKETIHAMFTEFSDIINIITILPYYEFFTGNSLTKTTHSTIKEDMHQYLIALHKLTNDESETNHKSAFKIINELELDAHDKWLLMTLYEDADALYAQYCDVMNTVIDYLTPHLSHFEQELNDFLDEWHAIERDPGLTNYFKDVYKFTIPEGGFQLIYPSIIGLNQGVFHNTHIYLGVILNAAVVKKGTLTFDIATRILKLLGDPTKASILQLLHTKVMYGKELANETGLTPATISYHMQELVNEQLILVTTDESSNRIYYQLNKEMVLDALSFMENALG